MLTIRNLSHDPFYNQAFEEYIYQTFPDDDIFFLWQNSPAVVVGLLIQNFGVFLCFFGVGFPCALERGEGRVVRVHLEDALGLQTEVGLDGCEVFLHLERQSLAAGQAALEGKKTFIESIKDHKSAEEIIANCIAKYKQAFPQYAK